MMTVLKVGLSVPFIEAKTETENVEDSGPKLHSWRRLDLNPAFPPAREGSLARDKEATGMRKILVTR